MNAKICKKLRREAEKMTIGQPGRRLVGQRVGKHGRGACAVNDPRSTCGVYRQLKRNVRELRNA